MGMSETPKVLLLPQPPSEGTSERGARRRGAVLCFTTPAGRSLKDYAVDRQRGRGRRGGGEEGGEGGGGAVQSSGLRNQRIRAQGLVVSCPTRDKTAPRHIDQGGGGGGGMHYHREGRQAGREGGWEGWGALSPLYLPCRLRRRSSPRAEGTMRRLPV